jgi:ATP-dependent DNA helicase RecQ
MKENAPFERSEASGGETPLAILQKYWQYDTFRPLQADIIQAVLDGQDTLALMPTGGGKSICFQVPAMLRAGVCVVVTPLIALMRDQVEQLQRRGIKAAAIYSGLRFREIDLILDEFVYNSEMKFLYVSPERLNSELMIERVKRMKIGMLVIDEAHCVSQWGYDFRPAYLKIANFKAILAKNVPTIALTATATADVKLDIVQQLNLTQPKVFVQSFARPNISYTVFDMEDKIRKLHEIASKVTGSGIVYVKNRRRTKEFSDLLNSWGIKADFYHAGLGTQERFKKQDDWIRNRTRVIVSTNAFGMGIDKPDVRFVVHLDPPESLEAYYQEAGRAGRDGQKAYAVLLYNPHDGDEIQDNTERKYPPLEAIRKVYQNLANYYKLAVGSQPTESLDFDIQDFVSNFGLNSNETHYCLKILEDEGYIHLNDAYFSPSKFTFEVDGRGLYSFQLRVPQYESFTKLLLRIYGGELFSNFTVISESAIAKQFYASTQEITNMLQYLHTAQIGIYEKQRSKPQLSYSQPRHDASTLPINMQALGNRKTRDLTKIKAIVNYATTKNHCRMLMLQAYFDEKSTTTCGICDNCLARKKQIIPSDLVAKYKQAILNYILQNPDANINEMVQSFTGIDTETLKKSLQELIDNETIVYQKGGVMRLK